MPHLILVRHATPQLEPNTPSHQWALSEEGRWQCVHLARKLNAYNIGAIFTSPELKAWETATILAEQWGDAPIKIHPELHEHDRRGVGWVEEGFDARIRTFFEHPTENVFGNETALQATARIQKAIAQCWTPNALHDQVIVSHGTVLSLFVSQVMPHITPFEFWKQLTMPAAIVLDLSSQNDSNLEQVKFNRYFPKLVF